MRGEGRPMSEGETDVDVYKCCHFFELDFVGEKDVVEFTAAK